jgi:hypothetical protein
MDDIGKAEDIVILGLVIVIGWALYEAGGAFASAINQFFGLSSGNAQTAPAGYGGTYVSAAGTTASDPLGSIESILGIGSGYPSAPANNNAGSLATTPTTGSGSGGGGGAAF